MKEILCNSVEVGQTSEMSEKRIKSLYKNRKKNVEEDNY